MTFIQVFIDVPNQVATDLKKVTTDLNNVKAVSNFERYSEHVKKLILLYGPRIIVGFVALTIGSWLISLVVRALNRLMLAREIDPTLRPFLKSLLSVSLKVMLLLSVASQIGIQTTSFVAALGAAGLAVGLALQGSLANFAGGVLILFFKPFKAGDYIGAQTYEGKVTEIQILYTTLTTADNKKVVIPNGLLSNNSVVNFSANDTRRVDLKINVDTGSDLAKAKKIIEKVVASNVLILEDPAPIIGVHDLTDSAMTFVCWVWVKKDDYLAVKHGIQESVKIAFDQEGIKLPSAMTIIQMGDGAQPPKGGSQIV